MCIICNLCHGDDYHSNVEKANDFLNKFECASKALKQTADAMLKCSKVAIKASDVERRYKSTHKKMVKLLCEWNSLENYRENAVLPENPNK